MLIEIPINHAFDDVEVTIAHDFAVVGVHIEHDFATDGSTATSTGTQLDNAEDNVVLTVDGHDAPITAKLQASADDVTYTDVEDSGLTIEVGETGAAWALGDYTIADDSYLRVVVEAGEASEGTVDDLTLYSSTVTSSSAQIDNIDALASVTCTGHDAEVTVNLEKSADNVAFEQVATATIAVDENGCSFDLAPLKLDKGVYLRITAVSLAESGVIGTFAVPTDGDTLTTAGHTLNNTKAIAALRCTGHDAAITAAIEVSVDNTAGSFIELPESETSIAVGQTVTQWHLQHYLLPKGCHLRVVATSEATEGVIDNLKILSNE
ncbi:MAG: hypothetical protein PHQ65_07805 [Bacteroidales bacterium]|nr:hypothetical protein [Bacteroidales bacterium]MDD3665154.1 hypothetical protein [Bacteroidales bacterium]